MKSTRKPAACSIPEGRKPSKAQYEKCCKDYGNLRRLIETQPELVSLLNRLIVRRGVKALGDVPPILPPHASVPWGHPCYRQCYAEMMYYMILAQRAADFIAAITPYNAANQSMQDCLTGIPT